MKPLREWPRPLMLLAVLAVLLLVGQLRGCFGEDNLEVSKAEALEIATTQLDFEADYVEVKFGRQGFGSRPVWAVLFAEVDEATEGGFGRRLVVEVDATSGDIRRTVRDDDA